MLPVLNRPTPRRPPRAASPFLPTDLADLALWLRADLAAFQFGGAPATTDGDLVDTWQDSSPPPAFDFSTSFRPIVRTGANGINGQTVHEYDGVNYYMTSSDTLAAFVTAAAHTLYAVARIETPSASSPTVYNNPCVLRDGGGYLGIHVHGPTTQLQGYLYDSTEKILAVAYTPGTVYGLEHHHEAGALYFRRSGLAEVSTAVGNLGSLTGVLSLSTALAGKLPMDLAEILIYKRALTGAERTSVRAYLADRYSLGVW